MSTSKVAMVAACPFPANYGSPGAIREMAESLATLEHEVHIVTYPFGEELPVRHVKIWRAWGWRKKPRIYSGPSVEKLLLDLLLLIKLCRVITKENIEIIHAHNYEGALIGFIAKLMTGRPLLYNAVNLMSDELPMYEFLRPAFLARRVAQFLDFLITRVPDGFIAITEDLRAALVTRDV
jgi:1,2-diacylglycerol 3-alpha-glucosyltransferase